MLRILKRYNYTININAHKAKENESIFYLWSFFMAELLLKAASLYQFKERRGAARRVCVRENFNADATNIRW